MNNLKLASKKADNSDPTDDNFITPLKEKEPLLNFLSDDTFDQILKKLNKENFQKTFSDIDFLQNLWKKIIVDAIHFLRINDDRERMFQDKGGKKTTMSTVGAAEMAIYNVYGIEELYGYFEQFTNFESTLYGADEHYRDHVVHPLKVWLIGLHILKEYGECFKLGVGGKEIIVKEMKDTEASGASSGASSIEEKKETDASSGTSSTDVKKETKLYISTAELTAMWTLIALTHDLGYPLEKVEKINDQLEKMLAKFGKIGFSRSRFNFETQHDHLVRFLLKLISSVLGQEQGQKSLWHTHLRTKYFTKFAKSWEMFDHGIVSSLILLKSLTFFIESDFSSDQYGCLDQKDARQFAIRSEILHSIASHTTPKIYHLAANNLSFLLVLCDELQEWGRPTMKDLRTGSLTGNARNVEIVECEITSEKNTIICNVEYDPQKWEQQKKHVERVFKAWHERLRPAAYDKKRNIKFKWIIKFEGSTTDWVFDLDTDKDVFQYLTCKGPKEGNPNNNEPFSLY